MFCQNCGAENKNGSAFCNSCGADLRLAPIMKESLVAKNVYNEIILGKIKILEAQKKGHVGPMILVIIGLALRLIAISPLYQDPWKLIGSLLIVIAIIWDLMRIYKANQLENEIKKLQAELK
jgi:uncharacterized membrane protein YvbJ